MNTTTTTTTNTEKAVWGGRTAAAFIDAHQCIDCGIYRVDVLFDGDLCDDCCPDDDHVDGPTVDFHE